MKEGMSADTEGEGIAYNKVDKALQSIGMTLKDTNGQFRDFDDVIEELASKWDTLDSLQQRYIATIFAGNRLLYCIIMLAVACSAQSAN